MRSSNEQTDSQDGSTYQELRLLSEVESTPETNQRDLARRLGIALGMTNILLHSLARKGYVRITRAGWRRWLYTLTPAGLSRKIQLTSAYIHRFLDQYQSMRQTLRDQLEFVALVPGSRVAIYGTDEFAELVYLGLKDLGIPEVDIFGPKSPVGGKFLGMSTNDLSTMRVESYDRVVVACLVDVDTMSRELLEHGVASGKLVTLFTDGSSGRGVAWVEGETHQEER